MTQAIEFDPVGNAQIKVFVSRGGEVAVKDGIPLAVEAAAHVPGAPAIDLARSDEVILAHRDVVAVFFDVLGVVTGAAGLSGGDGVPGSQNIDAVLVQQGECGMDG